MIPRVRRSSARCPRDSLPPRNVPTVTVPDVGCTSCVISRNTVVFPAPLSPRNTTHSPSSMRHDTESSTSRSRWRLVTCWKVIISALGLADFDMRLRAESLHPFVVLLPLLHLGHDVRQLVADLVERVLALGLAVVHLEDVEPDVVLEHVGHLS